MGSRGIRLGVALVVGTLLAACSTTTASKGIVSTSAAAPTPSVSTTAVNGAPSTAAGGTTTAAAEVPTGTVTVALDSEPPTLDPAGNSLTLANGSIYAAIFETLTADLPGQPLQPLLLVSMPTESPDRLAWTLKLRPGITFHDGTAFDAKAVKFNLDRQKISAFNGGTVLLIDSVTPDATDPLTVTVKLTKPWTAFPAVLAGIVGVMISPTTGKGGKSVARNPVGTGPYVFGAWQPGQSVTLKANPSYWGEQKARVGSLVFKFVPVEATRVAAFDAGEIDAYTTIVKSVADEAQGKGAQIAAPPPTGYGLFMINTANAPFDDPRVRQALELSWDRDAIAKAYGGQGYADFSWSPFVKGTEWWSSPAAELAFDPARARALLADYGKPVKFTVLQLKGSQQIEDSVRAVVDYWKQVGMDVSLDVVADISSYITSVVTGAYEVAGWIGGSLSDPDIVLYNLFHTAGSGNYMKFSSPDLDAALDEGRTATDPAARRAAYAKAQDLIRTLAPVLVTSHGQIFIVGSKKLTGLDPNYFFPSRTVGLRA